LECGVKIKEASQTYIDMANKLTQEESERLQSRMRGKLTRRVEDKKLNTLEALAIQLELDDEQLQEWREKMSEINEKEKKSSKK
jgi:hypothetical protein